MRWAILFLSILIVAACQTMSTVSERPVEPVDQVDISRVMGEWYIVGQIGSPAESKSHDIKEVFVWNPNEHRIDVSRTFINDKSELARDDDKKIFIEDDSYARWKIERYWALRLSQLVIDVGPDYSYLVLGNASRSRLYILARVPRLPNAVYSGILVRAQQKGYSISHIQRVSQSDTQKMQSTESTNRPLKTRR